MIAIEPEAHRHPQKGNGPSNRLSHSQSHSSLKDTLIMSHELTTTVWDSAPYDKTTLLVLLFLAYQTEESGQCWITVAGLASWARCTERHARSILSTLEADGWLITTEQVAGLPSMYAVTIPEGI